jgi:nucleotide-binding universal stress UspA family protein
MFYRTLLVHVDESRHLEKRVEVAAKLAVRENAHLIGVAATGSSHLVQHTAAASHDSGDSAANSDAVMGALRRSAEAALKKFETLARAIGATSCEQRLIDDDAAVAVSRQSLYADLIVLGQSDAADLSVAGTVDFPEYVVLNSECPVLIVPRAAGGDVTRYERALVAWNGSGAASRAVRDAMPFLEQATRVQIAVIDTSAASDRQGSESAGELTVFLARHGIHAEVVRRTEDDAGHEILSLAAELGADLLVMGCVAHPHTRSMKLGGATRVVLECATIPVLMSH